MELIPNDKLFIHLQRPHLIEVYCAFRSDFRYATLGTIEVLPVSKLSNYTQS